MSGAGAEHQAGSRPGQEGRSPASPTPPQRAANAPTLPAGEAPASTRPAAGEPELEAAQRQAEREADAARERDKQAMEHLKDVLTNVWQASAAVVEQALGLEKSTPDKPADTVALAAAAQDDTPGAEVVAYDERGNSSLAPLEAGSLISHRV